MRINRRFLRRTTFAGRRKPAMFGAVLIIFICAISVLLIDAKVRPAVRTAAQVRAHNLAVTAVNKSINNLLSNSDISYDSLVDIRTDQNGKIVSISTNAAGVNRLKAAVALAVDGALEENSGRKISIPIGSVSGIDILAGSGPHVSAKVEMTGSAQSDIKNTFITAGINQTQHRIMLNVKTEVYIFIGGNEKITEFESEFFIAETIIVGEVPQTMAQINVQQVPQK